MINNKTKSLYYCTPCIHRLGGHNKQIFLLYCNSKNFRCRFYEAAKVESMNFSPILFHGSHKISCNLLHKIFGYTVLCLKRVLLASATSKSCKFATRVSIFLIGKPIYSWFPNKSANDTYSHHYSSKFIHFLSFKVFILSFCLNLIRPYFLLLQLPYSKPQSDSRLCLRS